MLNLTSSEVFQVIFGVVGGLISLLLFGNFFFLKKLIAKVDLIDPLVVNLQSINKRLDTICEKMEEIDDIKIDVAKMKGRLSRYGGGNGRCLDSEDV